MLIMDQTTSAFIRSLKHPLKFRMFLLSQLPNAFFAGLRVKELDETICQVSVPYKWFTKNPFRSTYFACLSMAAEMSTGILAMAHVYKREPKISMLVIGIEGKFYKKATEPVVFTCTEGNLVRN